MAMASDFCTHSSRTFSHEVETEYGKGYLYVCHTCQTSFISQLPPKRDDYTDADFLFQGEEDFG